jgi:single-strand DNA-binding protein
MINICTFQGRLTKSPELRNTNSGTPVASFTIACDTGSGEHKQTLFLDCVAWKGRGETIAQYFDKGQMIVVSGSLGCRDWEDKNGNKRKNYELTVSDFGFCGSKRDPLDAVTQNAREQYGAPTYDGFAELSENEEELPF